jgi:uncharacterized membrane protein YfcA
LLNLDPSALAPLCAAAFAAGLTDSVVGGGGLIQLPALLILLPTASLPSVIGTNKLSSIFGTGAAAVAYTRKVKLEFGLTAAATGTAFAFSMLGARAVTLINPAVFKPFILVLLIAMAVFTFAHKDFGAMSHDRVAARPRIVRGAFIGIVLGFYDGFVGPGTGTVLIFLFIGAIGMDFLNASAAAKVVNVATNLAAIIFFAATGHIIYRYALPMAACNIVGGISGAHLAIRRGNRFVRIFFLVMIVAIIGRYGYDVMH